MLFNSQKQSFYAQITHIHIDLTCRDYANAKLTELTKITYFRHELGM